MFRLIIKIVQVNSNQAEKFTFFINYMNGSISYALCHLFFGLEPLDLKIHRQLGDTLSNGALQLLYMYNRLEMKFHTIHIYTHVNYTAIYALDTALIIICNFSDNHTQLILITKLISK